MISDVDGRIHSVDPGLPARIPDLAEQEQRRGLDLDCQLEAVWLGPQYRGRLRGGIDRGSQCGWRHLQECHLARIDRAVGEESQRFPWCDLLSLVDQPGAG